MQFERIAAALANALEPPARGAQPIPGNGSGRRTRHPPASHGSGRKFKRIAALPPLPLQQQGNRMAAFRRQLQPPGRGHGDALGLADHRAKSAVAQSVFHQG